MRKSFRETEEHKQGHLKKKGGFFGTFNKYWIVLNGKHLSIFSSSTDAIPSFEISLCRASVVVADHLLGKRCSLAIFPNPSAPQKNSYPGAPIYLLAETMADRDDWIRALSHACGRPEEEDEMVERTIEALIDCAVVSDEVGTIIGFNQAAEQLFGWSAFEIIGQNVTLLMPESVAVHHAKFMERYSRTKQGNLIGKPRQLMIRRRDGSLIPVEMSLGELPLKGDDNTARFIAVFRELAVDDTSRRPSVMVDYGPDSNYAMSDQKRRVSYVLNQHREMAHQLMEKLSEFADGENEEDEEDIDDLDKSLQDTSWRINAEAKEELELTEAEHQKQEQLLSAHKRSIDQMTQVSKNLDSLVRGLVKTAQDTTTSQMMVLLDDHVQKLRTLQKEVQNSQQTTQDLESQNELLKKLLTTRTNDLLRLQRKMASAPRGKVPLVPAIVRPDKSSSQTQTSFSGAPAEPSQKRTSFVSAVSEPNRPVVLMSFFDEEIQSLHSIVTRIYSKPFIRDHLDKVNFELSLPSPSTSVPSSIMGFDIEFLEALESFISTPAPAATPRNMTPQPTPPISSQPFLPETKPSTKKPTSAQKRQPSPSEPKRKASPARKKPTAPEPEPILRKQPSPAPQVRAPSRQDAAFSKARAVSNFRILMHKAKLNQIQVAIKNNEKLLGSAAIDSFLRRLEEQRKKAIERWEKTKCEILEQRQKQNHVYFRSMPGPPLSARTLEAAPLSARTLPPKPSSASSSASREGSSRFPKLPQIFPMKYTQLGAPPPSASSVSSDQGFDSLSLLGDESPRVANPGARLPQVSAKPPSGSPRSGAAFSRFVRQRDVNQALTIESLDRPQF